MLVVSIVSCALAITVSIIFFIFIHRFDNTLIAENYTHLAETSADIAARMNSLVENQSRSMVLLAENLEVMQDDIPILDYLEEAADTLGFSFVGIADAQGRLSAKSLTEPVDVSRQQYYLMAGTDTPSVGEMQRRSASGEETEEIVFALRYGKGTLVAFLTVEDLIDKLSTQPSHNNSLCLITEDGTLVSGMDIIADHDYFKFLQRLEFAQGYDYETVVQDIQSGGQGMAIYSEQDVRRLAYYVPLDFNGWTLVNTMPFSTLSGQATRLSHSLVFICMIVLAAFILLIIVIWSQLATLKSTKKANHAQTVFLSSMSHDMRTSLNSIIGLTEIADKHCTDTAPAHDCLEKVVDAGRQLQEQINDILELSRLESHQTRLDEQPATLSDIVDAIIDQVYPATRDRHRRFSITVHNVSHEYISVDGRRLSRACVNILNNAMRFTSEGGRISMDIAELPFPPDGYASYRFTFSDDGTGMSRDFMKRLFTPFSREQGDQVYRTDGSGLGMPIAKQLIDLMGGTIQVQSTVGKGTVFTVDLTVALDQRHSMDVPPQDIDTVLVVDTDSSQGNETLQTFERLGIHADLAPDEDTMIAFIADRQSSVNQYRAVFLDRLVYDAGCLARLPDRCIHFPPFILCAYDWRDIEQEAIEAGIAFCIRKPLFQSKLPPILRKLSEHIDGRGPMALDTKSSNFNGRRILIAEDNELNLEIAETVLRDADATVVSTRDGNECVRTFRESPEGWFDLILLDIQMPGMDGYAVARHIRAMDRTDSGLPIIAMSANTLEDDMDAAKAAGMDGYLTKPIDVAAWYLELERHLGT